MRKNILGLAVAAGLAMSMGSALAGQQSLAIKSTYQATKLAPPATKQASRTHSAYSPYGYTNGPGWSAAQVKRMARKSRNQRRNRVAHRGRQ